MPRIYIGSGTLSLEWIGASITATDYAAAIRAGRLLLEWCGTPPTRIYLGSATLLLEMLPGGRTYGHRASGSYGGLPDLALAGGQARLRVRGGTPTIVLRGAATPAGGLRGAALRWRTSASAEIDPLQAIDSIPGVALAHIGGRNGTGTAMLALLADGAELRYRAPGSTRFGPPVDASRASAVLRDGDDPDKWVEVTLSGARIPNVSCGAALILADGFNNGLDAGNVSAAQALAGDVTTYTVKLYNGAGASMTAVLVWLDSEVLYHELSWDGVSWHAPTSEAAALAGMGAQTIGPAAERTLHVRRTIPAATLASPALKLILHAGFDADGGGRAYSSCRSQYRIANAAEWRAYRKRDRKPIPGVDPVWAASASLPFTPADTFADGLWYLGLTYFDGYLESAVRTYRRLEVLTGLEIAQRPSAPFWYSVTPRAGGVTRVEGLYWGGFDADRLADEWALWYTTDGSEPGSGPPDYTATMTFERGYARYMQDLPAQADGTPVRVLLVARRAAGTAASETAADRATVAVATGPAAPTGSTVFGTQRPWSAT